MLPRDAAGADEQFRPIFDGKTLKGWDGNPKFWSVEDGPLPATTADNPAKGNTFLIWRGGRPANFELKCEFRMPNHGFANSGVQFRSWEEPKKWGRWAVGGYQADMDDTGKYVGDLYCERDRGQVAKRGQKVVIGDDHQGKVVGSVGDPAELLAKWKKYEWNDYDILADGNHIVLKINGYVTANVIDNDKNCGGSTASSPCNCTPATR